MADVPKPTTGYLVVDPDWDPVQAPAYGWWLPMTLKEAKARCRAFRESPKVILKVQTTYTLVEDGGND